MFRVIVIRRAGQLATLSTLETVRMGNLRLIGTIGAGLFFCVWAYAAPPASAPAGTTGLCKDGTFYSGATKKGTYSKVYHCQGDKWYGKTKDGEYLSEADAKAQGFKPDHGKACK